MSKGGRPAPRCRTEVHRPDGETESIPSKWITTLEAGAVVDVYTTGGGGYGPPSDRPPEDVERDLRQETISPSTAESEYDVVLDDDGSVDVDATARVREGSPTAAEGFVVDRGTLPDAVREDADR
ncbi:hypothetical protein GRS48_03385 [Halorubrum sp. JWXQ-INN 858]|uniref:hydantoinase B/oxoprolinase family protein n=1 Tax=Halorubrum sp. JWXQ-INN 858 TaxID=2690782 RepID=UPI00135CA5B8|nr:hydantoinase B/oxoprolinase family protein [Halorubrum sp. JWXQ-INN 858]MWV63868.1 hypothetical protein [Halorubrum sp. JWXQ-INN 858]